MRPVLALTLLTSVVLLVPVTGVSTAAAAAEGTVLTISDRPDPAVYSDEIGPAAADVVRHSGRLTAAAGEPVAGATVTLWRQLPGGEWKQYAEDATTDENGRYVFRTDAEGNADYQARYAGEGWTYLPADSAIEPLAVMRDFNAVLVEKRDKAVLEGNINPGWNNKVVRWQHKKCERCEWRVIDKAKSGDKGSWRFEGRYPRVGKTWYYRAVIGGTKKFVESVSATLVTTRTPTDSPAARSMAR